jgi:hypothetical protein
VTGAYAVQDRVAIAVTTEHELAICRREAPEPRIRTLGWRIDRLGQSDQLAQPRQTLHDAALIRAVQADQCAVCERPVL